MSLYVNKDEFKKQICCLSDIISKGIIVSAGLTADPTQALTTQKADLGDNLHFYSPNQTLEFTVTQGSAIVGVDIKDLNSTPNDYISYVNRIGDDLIFNSIGNAFAGTIDLSDFRVPAITYTAGTNITISSNNVISANVTNTGSIDYVSTVILNNNSLEFNSVGNGFSGVIDLSKYDNTNNVYMAGAGLTLSGSVFSHNLGNQITSNNTGNTVIQSLSTDVFGHIQSIGTTDLIETKLGSMSVGPATGTFIFQGNGVTQVGNTFTITNSQYTASNDVVLVGTDIQHVSYSGLDGVNENVGQVIKGLTISNGHVTGISYDATTNNTYTGSTHIDITSNQVNLIDPAPTFDAGTKTGMFGQYIQAITVDEIGRVTGLSFGTPTGINGGTVTHLGTTLTDLMDGNFFFEGSGVSYNLATQTFTITDTITTLNGESGNITFNGNGVTNIGDIFTFTDTQYTAGVGLLLSGNTFVHDNTSPLFANTYSSTNKVVDTIELDSFGHIQNITFTEIVIPENTQIVAGTNITLTGSGSSGDPFVINADTQSESYISNVDFSNNILTFTGVNNAYNQALDLSSLTPTAQTLSIAGDMLSISNGNTIQLPADENNYVNSVSVSGTSTKTLRLTRLGLPDLTAQWNDESNASQTLSLASNVLSISNGNSVTLPDDNNYATSMSVSGTGTKTLTLNRQGLTPISASWTDLNTPQSLSISGNDITISNGNTITVPSSNYIGNNQLHIAGGNLNMDNNSISNVTSLDTVNLEVTSESNLSGDILLNGKVYDSLGNLGSVGQYLSSITGGFTQWSTLPTQTNYTAGTGISISGGVISSTIIDTNNYITGISVTGTNTKTVTISRLNLPDLTTTFSDQTGSGSGNIADMITNVSLSGSNLQFTGQNGAFNGNVDISSINTDTNNFLSGASYSGSTLTLNRQGLSNVTVNIPSGADDMGLGFNLQKVSSFTHNVSNPGGAVHTVRVGDGLDAVFNGTDLTTITHEDTSAVTDLTPLQNEFVNGLTFDNYGHVISYSTSQLSGTGTGDNMGLGFTVSGITGTNFNVTFNNSGNVIPALQFQGSGLEAIDLGNKVVRVTHADTSSQASVTNTGNDYIQSITLDSFGHIESITSGTITGGGAADGYIGTAQNHTAGGNLNMDNNSISNVNELELASLSTTGWTFQEGGGDMVITPPSSGSGFYSLNETGTPSAGTDLVDVAYLNTVLGGADNNGIFTASNNNGDWLANNINLTDITNVILGDEFFYLTEDGGVGNTYYQFNKTGWDFTNSNPGIPAYLRCSPSGVISAAATLQGISLSGRGSTLDLGTVVNGEVTIQGDEIILTTGSQLTGGSEGIYIPFLGSTNNPSLVESTTADRVVALQPDGRLVYLDPTSLSGGSTTDTHFLNTDLTGTGDRSHLNTGRINITANGTAVSTGLALRPDLDSAGISINKGGAATATMKVSIEGTTRNFSFNFASTGTGNALPQYNTHNDADSDSELLTGSAYQLVGDRTMYIKP